jgi:ATP-dependent RNA helicase RhlE
MDRVGISVLTIHGEKEQDQRTDVMKEFKEGASRLLIATDVSARGIDIPDVNYVINYDLPDKAENYVHRVGRTGRGVQKGIAVSFCSTEEKERLMEIQAFIHKDIEVVPIADQDYTETILLTEKFDDVEALIEANELRYKSKKRKKPSPKK